MTVNYHFVYTVWYNFASWPAIQFTYFVFWNHLLEFIRLFCWIFLCNWRVRTIWQNGAKIFRISDQINGIRIVYFKNTGSLPLKQLLSSSLLLKIKPCGFQSRIGDVEAESYNWSHFSLISHWFLVSRLALGNKSNVPWCALRLVFLVS